MEKRDRRNCGQIWSNDDIWPLSDSAPVRAGKPLNRKEGLANLYLLCSKRDGRMCRLLVRQLRRCVRLCRVIRSFFSVLLASFVMSLAAVFGCSAMALGGILMFLRGGGMRFNYMVVFVH